MPSAEYIQRLRSDSGGKNRKGRLIMGTRVTEGGVWDRQQRAAAIRERDELREQLADADKRNEADTKLLIRAANQRDEARAALREAIQFRDRNLSGYDLAAWRKAAGMEEPT